MLLRKEATHTSWGKLYDVSLWENIRFPKGQNYEAVSYTHLNIEVTGWKPRKEALAMAKGADAFVLCLSLIHICEYKKLAEAEDKVIFGGRLGEYKYYDMDQVIAAVLDKCEKELGE